MTAVAEPVQSTHALDRIRLIDVDSHVGEPADIWTKRLPAKWQHLAPKIVEDKTGKLIWATGDNIICSVHDELYARDFDQETQDAASQAEARLRWMDRQGVYAQVIFPNILGFDVAEFMKMDPELSLLSVQAFNDFMTDFCSVDKQRLIPLTNVPWWDLKASVKELERCYDLGHRGLNLGWQYEQIGLPRLRDSHWEPLLKTAEEMGIPVNFHIGFNSVKLEDTGFNSLPDLDALAFSAMNFAGNMRCIVELIMGRICDRYPTLKFISVESGVGFVPYLMDMLDWQFLNRNTFDKFPDMLLPSEYFKRQIFATFWFEKNIGRIADLYPDNFMFSSDFPHPTSLTPGDHLPYVKGPRDTIKSNLADVPEPILTKMLQDTAAQMFGIDLPPAAPSRS
ncbi:amidohydrolase family protein [Dactylosporangium sp. NPDC000555]|uniref:amidohydrolase family protein n=1 Tax=Dactylosporangium sp. NPDC000555 TaxID=3154260 RepID=UPI003334871F